MNREEFRSNFECLSDLIEYCYENDLYTCEQTYSRDSLDELIDAVIPEFIKSNSWQTLYHKLDDIYNSDSEYYVDDGWLSFCGLDDDDDLTDYCDRAYEEACETGLFDEHDDGEEDEDQNYSNEPYEVNMESTEDQTSPAEPNHDFMYSCDMDLGEFLMIK